MNGSGYAPDGGAINTGDLSATGHQLIRAGLLCNDAQVRLQDNNWTVNGDPMEGALVTLAMKAGLDVDQERGGSARVDEIPFDAQHRFMATLNRDTSGRKLVLVKGAPERLLDMCSRQQGEDDHEPLQTEHWQAQIDAAAAEGERVLGFAYKPAPDGAERLDFADLEQGLIFLGLVGFIDPPREEAIAAIAECQSAGIAVKMITGDHAATAAAIAQQLGLGDSPKVITGQQLDDIPDADLEAAVKDTVVFARTSPEHKLRIVRALQADNAVVAMTGDGVNDAPSLKQSNIGIAMGKKGTEAAKEASQMVLLDDNFATIVAAVHEGRTVYDNIRKVVAWTLPTNGGEVLTVMAAILLNFTMPMSPVQILWINMITAVTLGLVLAFEPAEDNVMDRPPRPSNTGILTPFLVWRVVFVSVLFLIGSLAIFFYALSSGLDLDTARTMVVNTVVVLEVFYLFNVRYLNSSSFTWRGALGTKPVLIAVGTVVGAQLAFTYVPFMQGLFATQPIGLMNGLLILGVGVVAMAILEGEKHVMRKLGKLAQ